MAAPNVFFTTTNNRISNQNGFNSISVTFSTDSYCPKFECRATKINAEYGVGIGELIAAFSFTPANVERTFEIYDTHLVEGEGDYRISLFAQGSDGSWNDNHGFIPSGENVALITADGEEFLCMRYEVTDDGI